MKVTINELERILVIEKVIGDRDFFINAVKKIDSKNSDKNALMWVSDKNSALLSGMDTGVVLCSSVVADKYEGGLTMLVTPNPRFAFQQVVVNFFTQAKQPSISAKSDLHETVILGDDCCIGNFVTIEEGCVIGNNVEIGHNSVILKDTVIHNHVKIGNNCTIGGVGFGYEKDPLSGEFALIPHIGNVILMEGVEIGNNSCVDRAVLGSTILKENVKVDNLVHIAHGVIVGENSLVIANAMIAGSVEIGQNCWIAPSVSILNKKSIGDNVVVGIGSLVMKDTPSNVTVMGVPAEEMKMALRTKNILKAIISEYSERS